MAPLPQGPRELTTLGSALADAAAAAGKPDAVTGECQRLLDDLRKRCPDILGDRGPTGDEARRAARAKLVRGRPPAGAQVIDASRPPA